MARFAIVAPPQILNSLDKVLELGNAHLLLAHDVVKRPEAYRALFHPEYRSRRQYMHNRLIIMDNSVVELGSAVDLDMISGACEITQPTCVVLPDVMLEPGYTIDSCQRALDEWPKKLKPTIPFVLIPQGTTLRLFATCAEAFAENSQIKYWGVPRNIVKYHGSRRQAIKLLRAINPHRKIHMFGFSDNMIDDVLCAREPEVESIDSAVPLRHPYELSLTSETTPRGDWWETGEYTPLTLKNLKLARNWFRTTNRFNESST